MSINVNNTNMNMDAFDFSDDEYSDLSSHTHSSYDDDNDNDDLLTDVHSTTPLRSLEPTSQLGIGRQLKHELFVPCGEPDDRERCGWFLQDNQIAMFFSEDYLPPTYVDILGVKYEGRYFYPEKAMFYAIIEIDGVRMENHELQSPEFDLINRYRGKLMQIRDAFARFPDIFHEHAVQALFFPAMFKVYIKDIKQMHLDSVASKIMNYRRFAEWEIAQNAATRANPGMGDALSTYVGNFVSDS